MGTPIDIAADYRCELFLQTFRNPCLSGFIKKYSVIIFYFSLCVVHLKTVLTEPDQMSQQSQQREVASADETILTVGDLSISIFIMTRHYGKKSIEAKIQFDQLRTTHGSF